MAAKPKTISSTDLKNTKDQDEYDKKDKDDVEDIEDDDEQDNYENPKKNGKQIKINPPFINADNDVSESIELLPEELQDDAIENLANEIMEQIAESLLQLAEDTGQDFDVLFEVFKRGFDQNFDETLTEDFDYLEFAFDRVESFVNEGLAYQVDADLLAEGESAGLVGTDKLVQNYTEVTPGQKLISKIKDKKNV